MSSVDTSNKLLTAEEFAVLEGIEAPCELIGGEIVMTPMPSFEHGDACGTISRAFGNYVAERGLGRVLANDAGVVTHRHPDTVRGADVAFYSYSAVPKGPRPKPYSANPPELVFEVKPPSDRWAEIDRKVAEYLAAGVQAVCVVDPETETAISHFANKPPVSHAASDELSFPGILDGFSVQLSELLA